MTPPRIGVEFTITGTTAEQIEVAARKRCEEFFGRGTTYQLTVEAAPLTATYSGEVHMYEARVHAVQGRGG